MININNKSWDEVSSIDIEHLLSEEFEENCFFELKADDESPEKIAKEISSFANTYGGYILLGINDDKTIGGCEKWNEQRIHVTIHDSITPTPNFDVKKIKIGDKKIYVIKIEEGTIPPYITNKGEIYERISSGAFKIKDSIRLSQLSQKKDNQLKRIKEKIELDKIILSTNNSNNLCGYLDMGFSVVCSEKTTLQKNFYNLNLEKIKADLKEDVSDCNISRIGRSYVFSIGEITINDNRKDNTLLPAGLQNFIEIMFDGSVKCRVLLTSDNPHSEKVNISHIIFYYGIIFKKIYSELLGDNFSKIFIHAHKYEQLTILQQFVPYWKFRDTKSNQMYTKYFNQHKTKYGYNLIIMGNRNPTSDYILIDRQLFDIIEIEYNTENLLDELFNVLNYNLGYIDSFPHTEES